VSVFFVWVSVGLAGGNGEDGTCQLCKASFQGGPVETAEMEKIQIGSLSSYITFDEETWKRDARHDGRGHALASYDGDEIDLADGYVAFRIN